MRFFLLARDRSNGRVRLMSDRAFDTAAAAVHAASSSSAARELGDDEVFAIDLDSAGPVLVLRVPAVSAQCAPPKSVSVEEPESVAPRADGAPSDRCVPDTEVRAAGELRAALAAFIKPVAPAKRQRPRFPLFGARDDAEAGSATEAAPDVAPVGRPEMDLVIELRDVDDRSHEDWDARTHEEYALPSDGALSAAAEEGIGRLDAAVSFETDLDASDERRPDADVTEGEIGSDLDDLDEPDASPADEPMPSADRIDHGWWDGRVDASASRADAADACAATEEPSSVFWEPSATYYRPANTDFTIWVCADCIYQRTCAKAGTTAPAACGNFQWRSR